MYKRTRNRNKLAILPLLFAGVLLVSGTFAWFVYYSNVETNMTGHVVGWDIKFEGEDINKEIALQVQKVYPGMDEFEGYLTITNSGETSAVITSVLKSVTVLGETYSVGDEVDGVVLTSEGLKEFLANKYPFKFSFSVDKSTIAPNETTQFKATVNWAFETYIKVNDTDVFDIDKSYYTLNGSNYIYDELVSDANFDEKKEGLYYINDIEDTYWGEEANKFVKENEDTPCITIVLQVNATQDTK